MLLFGTKIISTTTVKPRYLTTVCSPRAQMMARGKGSDILRVAWKINGATGATRPSEWHTPSCPSSF